MINKNKYKRSIEDAGIITINLPELTVTPRGNYINYTGNETIVPTLEDYKNAEINKSRINAVNAMLAAKSPSIPNIPSRNPLSILAGKLGMSDDTRKYVFGIDKKGSTCIYSATTKYNDPNAEISGNKTFYKNPEKYGFKKVYNKASKIGDLVQFNGYKGPHHAAMITGFDKNGIPLISYSNGERTNDSFIETKEGNKILVPTMKKDKELDKYLIDALGDISTYRYVGTTEKLNALKKRYNYLYNKK